MSQTTPLSTKHVPHPATNEAKQERVLAAMANDPHSSIQKTAPEVGISPSSVSKILKLHQFHPYKIQILQKLNEDDPDRRVEFCQKMMDNANQNENLIRSICFSDEATFFVNGEVNRHNMRYWSQQNPNWFDGIKAQGLDKVKICQISSFYLK